MEENKVIWPGWEVVRKIGSGSFGAVYEIQRDMFGDVEKAALKVIHIPQNRDEIQELRSLGYDDASITTHFKGYLEDIVREYSLMNKMKGHTNVVYCDDIRYEQASDGIGWDIFIKMELLTPLMNDLAAVSTEDRVVQLGRDLCNALVLCKERNIVHRDIKPQNIFMCGEDRGAHHRRHQDRYIQVHGAGGLQQPALWPQLRYLCPGPGAVLAAERKADAFPAHAAPDPHGGHGGCFPPAPVHR